MKKDLKGQRFGRWIVLERSAPRADNADRWRCICECGATVSVRTRNLLSGRSLSCGCRGQEARREGLAKYWKKRRAITSSAAESPIGHRVPMAAYSAYADEDAGIAGDDLEQAELDAIRELYRPGE